MSVQLHPWPCHHSMSSFVFQFPPPCNSLLSIYYKQHGDTTLGLHVLPNIPYYSLFYLLPKHYTQLSKVSCYFLTRITFLFFRVWEHAFFVVVVSLLLLFLFVCCVLFCWEFTRSIWNVYISITILFRMTEAFSKMIKDFYHGLYFLLSPYQTHL